MINDTIDQNQHNALRGLTKEEILDQTSRALIMFVAMAKTQNNLYTHFLGFFKHEKKAAFNNLIAASNLFVSTIKENMPQESIEAADKLEEHFQDYVYSLIKRGDYLTDSNTILKNRLTEMLEEPEMLQYDTYAINQVIKLLDKSKA
jgi:hypothetical protein